MKSFGKSLAQLFVALPATIMFLLPMNAGAVVISSNERIFNFDLSGQTPTPNYNFIQFGINTSLNNPVSGNDVMWTKFYGGVNGSDFITTLIMPQVFWNADGTKSEFSTANKIYDPLLDGKFSVGLRMDSGTSDVLSINASGAKLVSSDYIYTPSIQGLYTSGNIPPPPPSKTTFQFPLSTPSAGTTVYLTTVAGGSSVACGPIIKGDPGHCSDFANPTLSSFEKAEAIRLGLGEQYVIEKLQQTHGYYDIYHDVAHYALDFAAVGGSANVIAAKGGTVVSVTGQPGKCETAPYPCIVIDNGDGYFTEYREFSSFGLQSFKIGDIVADQQLLGILDPGLGNHLHFQTMTKSGSKYDSSASNPLLADVTVGGRLFKDYSLEGTMTHPLPSQIYGQKNPLLPKTYDSNSLAAKFNLVVGNLGLGASKDLPIYIDPLIAIGYDYQIDSGPNFASFFLPNIGDGQYELWLWDVSLSQFIFYEMVTHDTEFDFALGGVDRFRILGIELGAGLDPNDPQAFVTGLTFAELGNVEMTMTPLTQNVPEPTTIPLVLAALGLLGFARWRKQ